MDPTLKRAYKIIFEAEPEPGMKDWQIAEKLLDRFNVRKLGEELAKECVHRIVNYIKYPDRETTTRIVGRAEGFASELWEGLPDEPHMAELERLEYLEHGKKSKPR
jgi:hypothetical protein